MNTKIQIKEGWTINPETKVVRSIRRESVENLVGSFFYFLIYVMTEREQKLFDTIDNTASIVLHRDHKVAEGGRKGLVESLSDFYDKIKNLAEKTGEDSGDDILTLLYSGRSAMEKDRKKIQFDLENFEVVDDGIIGCGVPYVLCFGGGDWEQPVYFFVYPEAKTGNPRVYIPARGNAFNKKLKVAFGSEDEVKTYSDNDARIQEEKEYIISNSGLATGYTKQEISEVAKTLDLEDLLYEKLEYDTDLMLTELEERIAV
jgi:hypothetical protein